MSRERILGNIRQALKRSSRPDTVPLETRLREAPTGPIPARGQLPPAQRIELFIEMAKRAVASVTRVASAAEVPAAVAEFLARENLPARLGAWLLGRLGRARGGFKRLPLAGGWTATRDMPAPQGATFHALWAARRRAPGR